jgi:hypothetical protein
MEPFIFSKYGRMISTTLATFKKISGICQGMDFLLAFFAMQYYLDP